MITPRTFKQKCRSTKTYERTSTDENLSSITSCHITIKFAVGIEENEEKLPTLNRLRYTWPYKAGFVANSSSRTTTDLSKLLTSCLTAVKNPFNCETAYEREGKNHIWSIKNSSEIINKLKSKCFKASELSIYDFATLYTMLPHQTFWLNWANFSLENALYLACNEKHAFSLLINTKITNYGLAEKFVTPLFIFWIILY